MRSNYNLLTVLQVAFRWWRHILGAVVLTIATVFIVTLPQVTPPLYQAKTVIYPTDPAITDKSYLMQTPGHKIDFFGRRFDFDRIHAIAESTPLIKVVIREAGLFQQQGVDTFRQAGRMHKMVKNFRDRYQVFINERRGLEIRYKAEDPELAARVVNKVVEVIDQRNRSLIYSKRQQAKSVLEGEIKKKRTAIGELRDSITRLRTEHHLLNTKRQSVGEILLLEFLEGANRQPDKPISTFLEDRDFSATIKANDQLFVLHTELNHLLDELKQLKVAYEQFHVSTSDTLSTIYTLHKAYPPERPARNRWLLIAGSGLAVLFLSVLLVNLLTAIKT